MSVYLSCLILNSFISENQSTCETSLRPATIMTCRKNFTYLLYFFSMSSNMSKLWLVIQTIKYTILNWLVELQNAQLSTSFFEL